MNTSNLKPIGKLARDLAKEAGKVALQKFTQLKEVEEKDDTTFVSNADREIEQMLRAKIKARFPDHTIIGEEYGTAKGASQYSWYLDPIDGTTNFITEVPIFGPLIACVTNHEPLAAATYLPVTQKVVWATKENGAFIDDQPVHLPKPEPLNKITLISDPGHQPHSQPWCRQFLYQHEAKFRSCRRYGSVLSSLIWLASGKLQVYLAAGAQKHDLIAPALICQEAGYTVTNLEGEPWNYQQHSDLLITHPMLTQQIVSMTRTIQL